MARIDGLSLGMISAGGLFAYAAVKGYSIPHALQALIQGKPPGTGGQANPIILTSAAAAGPGAAGAAPGTVTVTGRGQISPAQAYKALRQAGIPVGDAITLTAIGGVESGWNTNSLNNNPATGDYSVGVWQINYFDGLAGPRTAEFGGPQELLGNLPAQARAVYILWSQSGLQPWGPDISSGKINAFMGQALAAAGQ